MAGAEGVVSPSPPPQTDHLLCSSSYGVAAMSQSRLHNFSFPSMSWGCQRLLCCAKVDPRGAPPCLDGASSEGSVPPMRQRREASPLLGCWERSEDVRGDGGKGGRAGDERLERFGDATMAKFQKAVDKIPLPQPLAALKESKEVAEPSPGSAGAEASRPWNLRLRRAVCHTTAPENGVPQAKNRKRDESRTAREKNPAAVKHSGRIPKLDGGPEKERRRPRFSPALSKEEIEGDFVLMSGLKPPRRPKKRPRNVQKQIEMLYPGFYLTEVTPDSYQ